MYPRSSELSLGLIQLDKKNEAAVRIFVRIYLVRSYIVFICSIPGTGMCQRCVSLFLFRLPSHYWHQILFCTTCYFCFRRPLPLLIMENEVCLRKKGRSYTRVCIYLRLHQKRKCTRLYITSTWPLSRFSILHSSITPLRRGSL